MEDAVAAAEEGLVEDPDNLIYLKALTLAFRDLGDYEESIAMAQRWRRAQPDSGVPYILEAESLEALGRLDEADKALDSALTRNIEPEIYRSVLEDQRASVAGKRARLALGTTTPTLDSKRQYKACIDAATGEEKDPAAAATYCRNAAQDHHLDDFSRRAATGHFGVALHALGLKPEAVLAAEEGLRHWPDDLLILSVLVASAMEIGENEKALNAATRMMSISPGDPEPAVRAALMLARLGRFDEADPTLAHAIALGADSEFSQHVRQEIAQGRANAHATREDPALDPLNGAFVVIANANVRADASVSSQRLRTLPLGDQVTALGKVRDSDWYLISRNGQRLGYVFGPLVAPVGSAKAMAALDRAGPTQAAPPPTATVAENRDAVAVIIGNRTYSRDVPEVSYAHNDADAMKRYVMDVLGYRDGNVIDLRDATLADLNRVFGNDRNPRAQLANWIRAGRSDVTVFYSGHGVPGLNDKRGYLLPVDGDPNLAEVTGYPLDVLQRNLAKLPARSMQIFIDACFSGNSAGGVLLRATSGIGISTPLAETAGERFVMITAASGDQVASWDHDVKQGLFTRHLLAALGGVADGTDWGNGDGNVTLSEVKAYLDDEMTFQARRRFNRDQRASIVGTMSQVVAQGGD
ncbi:MAG: caspase family protein [Alphaproteobacteria bacterium]